MAYMYPHELSDAHGSEAERLTFELLKRELSESFYCYHSRPLLTLGPRGAREGEIDFVILHRELGLLALEVKGGGLSRDGRGGWFHVGKQGQRTPLRKDPFAQARDNLHALVQMLTARLHSVLPEWNGRLPFPFGYAVLMPDVSAAAVPALPSGICPELLLDATALDDLEARVRAAMAVWSRGRPPVDFNELKRFRRHVLLPALKLMPTLASLFRREGAALARLAAVQSRLLDATAAIPRTRVLGPAGTGKTVLAVERARRLAAGGARTCLLCYNRPLAEELSAIVADEEALPTLHVSTFHALCRRGAELLGRPFVIPTEIEEAQRFWRCRAPALLRDAVAAGLLGYDAVLVDEAQDLECEWWDTVQTLVPANGPLWVFVDPDQDIYGRAPSMPENLVPLLLNANCRSTRRLRALCDRITGNDTQSAEFVPQGRKPLEVQYTDAADLRQKLEGQVAELCGAQQLDPAQLVIISPHPQPGSSLAGVESLAGIPLVPYREQRGLLCTTAQRFTGLEADVVLLIDQDLADPACTPVHRYLAASRARHLLVVFCKGSWLPEEEAGT